MEIFTDGSHSLKPRMSGVGAVIISNGREYEIGASTNKCENNNVAEVMAIAFAIKFIKESNILEQCKDKNILIFSDSMYALRKINQKAQGCDEYEQKALDYIQRFQETSKKRVTFFQVKGHIHDGTKLSHYNNIADTLAQDYRYLGLVKYQDQIYRQSLLQSCKNHR